MAAHEESVGGREELALGLISGTSMDGVDAALVACDSAPDARPRLVAFRSRPYAEDLRERLAACAAGGSSAEVARLDAAVGEAFAVAALELLESGVVAAGEVLCIGSHGQTLFHAPEPVTIGGVPVRGSLQIGNPAVIAARTGITTVADFRSMDLALGGQGAPLVPLLDWRCFTRSDRGRVLLNLGGIANVTGLPPGAPVEDVVAFDTGPANVLLDLVCRVRDVRGGFDEGGALAAEGRVDPDLLDRLRSHAFFPTPPPKSADIADFLEAHGKLLQASPLPTADLLATLVELTAATVAEATERWIAPRQPVDELLVSGGGVHNAAVMSALARTLGKPVRPLPAEGRITADAKEAAAFAYLARERLAGRPGNVPGATGARAFALLGSVVLPPTV